MKGSFYIMKKIRGILLSIILLTGLLSGCGSTTTNSNGSSDKQSSIIKVGVTAGPHEEVLQEVKKVAEKQGLNVEITTFNDYVQPNIQLNDKQLDINVFQTTPYLEEFNKKHNMNLIPVAKAILLPMGIYSKKIKSLDQLKVGDKIAVPNDPTQEARSLALLEKAHVIKLKSGVGITATIKDIISNPKNIQFLEADASMTPRTLDDAAASAINTNYALVAKLNPKKDAIFLESAEKSPWINYIVTRQDNKNSENVKKFIKVYQSAEVKTYIDKHFQGSIIAAF